MERARGALGVAAREHNRLAYGLGKGGDGEGLGAVAEVLDPGPENAATIRSIAVNNKSTL